MATEQRFRVMGSEAHVIVVGGPPALAAQAERRLRQLEQRWTRFAPDSELSALNRADGDPCVVSHDTLVLVDALCQAWERTSGRFDPTVHDALVALGYQHSWPGVTGVGATGPVAVPGCRGVRVHRDRAVVQLPAGVRLDPGGLGKGLAADLVVNELRAAGAAGALVNVGGDLRVDGRPPVGENWRIAIEHPDGPDAVGDVTLSGGGVATTTCARRRWRTAAGTVVHHLVDPATGRPADRPWRQVTVVAGSAWWAEVAATAAYLVGALPEGAAAAFVVDADDRIRYLGEDADRWFYGAREAPATSPLNRGAA
jgi:thiamine biosynthesis lipoprotein